MSGWSKIIGKIHSSFCPQCGTYLLLSDHGNIECQVCQYVIKEEGLLLFLFL